jgi:hypothetical protein
LKRKRFELVKEFDLEGFGDACIINIAQKEKAADQRLAEAKQAEHQRPVRAETAPDATALG